MVRNSETDILIVIIVITFQITIIVKYSNKFYSLLYVIKYINRRLAPDKMIFVITHGVHIVEEGGEGDALLFANLHALAICINSKALSIPLQ